MRTSAKRALTRQRCGRVATGLLVLAFAGNLGATEPGEASGPQTTQGQVWLDRLIEAKSHLARTIEQVGDTAVALIGTPYKRGGNSPEAGFDCSGLVRYVFQRVAQIELPRTALGISAFGLEVGREDLQPGDLLFFNTLRADFSHVGIYLGDHRFVHSPSSGKAVEIVDLRARYWQRAYNGARRLLRAEGE